MALRLSEIASTIGAKVHGDTSIDVTGVSNIEGAGKGDITFLADLKYLAAAKNSLASAIITSEILDLPQPQLVVSNPYLAFSKIIEIFHPPKVFDGTIHPTAVIKSSVGLGEHVTVYPHVYIDDGCVIGDRVVIEPGVFIGSHTQIGKDTVIHANVSIYDHSQIGERVIIHSGTVLGADGFGFIRGDDGKHHKIPQVGHVVIEDDVEIGANVCIDRATLGRTIVRKGTKFDNLVQVGHNVEIGEDSILVALVGISGSVKLGRNVTLAGQVGVRDHVTIGDNTVIIGQTGITHDIPPNSVMAGTPAVPFKEWKRIALSLNKLPELIKKVRELEKKIFNREA